MHQQQLHRRPTISVKVGNTTIGGEAPIRVQSMTNTPTLDTDASVAQVISIANAGADIIRLTAQGVAHAKNLGVIRQQVRKQGIVTPLVADIHFSPAAAFEAAKCVEKVRINPGNFFDPGRTFRKMDFTDEEYATELLRLRQKFIPFLQLCKENGTAIRIGVNHGSLSDRIMSRFGSDAEGMVESAMEFLEICRDEDFNNVVISIKASDVCMMTRTVRLLVKTMNERDMHYPLHLGVTEAGNALEGRVKSAAGIGSLLVDGIGDTIRVSLSETPEAEIPVAHSILKHIEMMGNSDPLVETGLKRHLSLPNIDIPIGGNEPTIIVNDKYSEEQIKSVADFYKAPQNDRICKLRQSLREHYSKKDIRPAVVVFEYPQEMSADDVIIAASVDMGTILLDGYRDAVMLSAPSLSPEKSIELCQTIIQAVGITRYKADIVACPGCGRTLYKLEDALEDVKKACEHLKHLKIAVMGCIVNGPGEMAGADYGYVGAGPNRVSIYRGIDCIIKNIPQIEALPALINLIKDDGLWIDPISNE